MTPISEQELPSETQPRRPLEVLFVTRKWPPAVGGMETYSVELVEALRAAGHEVELVHLAGQEDGSAPGALGLIWFGLRSGWRLLFRRGDWDVVHGGDLAIWPLVWLAVLFAHARPGVALSAHGTDVSLATRPGLKGRLYGAYLGLGRWLLPDRLRIIANSDATAQRVLDLGFPHVPTVPLGCRVRVDAPIDEAPTTLLFAGRLVARKGLSWFVREVLPDLSSDLRLAVAGTEWDASESATLGDARVDFLGPLPQDELWQRMGTALAVVIPNLRAGAHQFEGFGLVAVEAAQSGGLVLASALDGYTSSVVDGLTGQHLPPGDKAAWVSAIGELQALTFEQREVMRTRARAAALERFSWDRVLGDTLAVYRDSP